MSYTDQAQFHPGYYLTALARALVGAGGTLMENARVIDVVEEDGACRVVTTAGELVAGHVVLATQYPILDRGAQFTSLSARRSYGVAGVLPDGATAGMSINVGSPTRSTRTAHLGGENLLVVVGAGHPVGKADDTGQRWENLRGWAREHFGVEDFRYHWSAQETTTQDRMPLVGFLHPGTDRVPTATGFDGWGMTNGTASALILRDLITGQDNPWSAALDARRTAPDMPDSRPAPEEGAVAKTWHQDRAEETRPASVQDLRPGEAAVLDVDGEHTAAHRDEHGDLHVLSAVCTHRACTVAWNAAERSWDCPCHGARFDTDGHVLHGPATTPLQRRHPS